jgi:hypothetical protein
VLLTEAIGAEDFTAEDGAASVSVTSSSLTSSSSSESLRMMTLSSPGGLRSPRLKSQKSLLTISSSHEVSGMRFSSSEEERFTTGIFLEGLPYSRTGEQGRHEETSDGDPGGGGDPDDTGGGVEPSLDDEKPSLEGQRERIVPLLSSIVAKRRRR